MKIIRKGKMENKAKRFKCDYCGCIFKCNKDEYEFQSTKLGRGFYIANCPTCEETVYKEK